jgi:hypothetical protein
MYEEMDGAELNDREEAATKLVHPATGQTFCELAAEELARGVKLDPTVMARVKRIAPYYIGPADAKWSLPEALLLHFPGDEDFQDIADGEYALSMARDADEYIAEMGSALQRTRLRFDNDIFYAERRASRVKIPPGDGNPADVHLREERIDALASLLSLFAVPAKFAADPIERDAWAV